MESLFGLLVLLADLWAVYNVFQSAATTGNKVVWILVIALLPILGLILWYFMGPKPADG